MAKKIIAFDLDDTLSVAKSAISPEMAELLVRLLGKYEVCIISGGNLDQFKLQVINNLDARPDHLKKFHLMPTCGTQYYLYDEMTGDWARQYANEPTSEQKQRAAEALTNGAKELGLWPEQPYGEVVEDRGSQVTYSALGQQAPSDEKYAWDPDNAKRLKLREYVVPLVPDLEVRIGGTTSIDVTLAGVDKAYGMKNLMQATGVQMEEILFVGDKLDEGGNDYPVKALGVDSIAVNEWQDTARVIETLIKVA
jgi:HAD superfamily hydrolase (TIGR01484 family)